MHSRCSAESSLPGPRLFSPVSGLSVVIVGMVGALISLFVEGEMAALGGMVLAIGIVGLGLVFLAVRSHYGCICVSAREFPAYDGVSRAPGGS